LREGDEETTLDHRWSESHFIVGGTPGHYSGQCVVGEASPQPYKAYTWPGLMNRVNLWLGELKSDLETPDLWADLRRESETLVVAAEEPFDNTSFTADEQHEIAEQLRELKEYVKETYSLSEQAVQALEAKLEFLEVAAGRLGRTDWRALVVGTIATFILSSALPRESAREIFLTLVRSIGPVYGLPELPIS